MIRHDKVKNDWVDEHYDILLLRFSENNSDMDEFDEWADNEFDEISEYLFEEAFDNFRYCDTCEHICSEYDPYGTGDSPTAYSCDTVEPTDCPFVLEMIDNTVEGL